MNLLPEENIIYKTKLKEDEIIKRISEIIEPEKLLRSGLFRKSSGRPYEGKVTMKTFDIKRIIGYRNSFLPRIKGSIKSDYQGVAIDVKMRLPTLVIIFICVWCAIVISVFIAFLPQTSGRSGFDTVTLIPIAMLLIMAVLTWASFKYESKKSKKYFQTLFEAEMVEV